MASSLKRPEKEQKGGPPAVKGTDADLIGRHGYEYEIEEKRGGVSLDARKAESWGTRNRS